MDKQLQQIIDAVKAASPFIWHAAYRHAIVDSVTWMLFSFFLLGGAVVLRKLQLTIEDEMGFGLLTVAIVVVVLASGICLFSNAEQILNLDYSTIQAISALK